MMNGSKFNKQEKAPAAKERTAVERKPLEADKAGTVFKHESIKGPADLASANARTKEIFYNFVRDATEKNVTAKEVKDGINHIFDSLVVATQREIAKNPDAVKDVNLMPYSGITKMQQAILIKPSEAVEGCGLPDCGSGGEMIMKTAIVKWCKELEGVSNSDYARGLGIVALKSGMKIMLYPKAAIDAVVKLVGDYKLAIVESGSDSIDYNWYGHLSQLSRLPAQGDFVMMNRDTMKSVMEACIYMAKTANQLVVTLVTEANGAKLTVPRKNYTIVAGSAFAAIINAAFEMAGKYNDYTTERQAKLTSEFDAASYTGTSYAADIERRLRFVYSPDGQKVRLDKTKRGAAKYGDNEERYAAAGEDAEKIPDYFESRAKVAAAGKGTVTPKKLLDLEYSGVNMKAIVTAGERSAAIEIGFLFGELASAFSP